MKVVYMIAITLYYQGYTQTYFALKKLGEKIKIDISSVNYIKTCSFSIS